MRQLHQSDLVLCLDTTSLAPRGNALLLGTDRGDVGDGGTVAKGRCGRLLKIISDTVDIHMKRKGEDGEIYHIVMNSDTRLSISTTSLNARPLFRQLEPPDLVLADTYIDLPRWLRQLPLPAFTGSIASYEFQIGGSPHCGT